MSHTHLNFPLSPPSPPLPLLLLSPSLPIPLFLPLPLSPLHSPSPSPLPIPLSLPFPLLLPFPLSSPPPHPTFLTSSSPYIPLLLLSLSHTQFLSWCHWEVHVWVLWGQCRPRRGVLGATVLPTTRIPTVKVLAWGGSKGCSEGNEARTEGLPHQGQDYTVHGKGVLSGWVETSSSFRHTHTHHVCAHTQTHMQSTRNTHRHTCKAHATHTHHETLKHAQKHMTWPTHKHADTP